MLLIYHSIKFDANKNGREKLVFLYELNQWQCYWKSSAVAEMRQQTFFFPVLHLFSFKIVFFVLMHLIL